MIWQSVLLVFALTEAFWLGTYVLIHVNVSATRTSNANSNVVFGEELARQLTARLVEGCREHHVTMVRILVGICLG